MADIQALATVSEIDGHAVIRDVNGVVRELNEGARLLPGETIATVKDSSVEVVSLAGEIVTVPENDALYINSEIFASTSYTRADGELADATVQEVLDIFANNPDLAGALEDPAAGGFLSNEAGHSFVRLSLALDTLPDFQRTTFDLPLDPNDLAPNEPDPNSDNQQFAAKVGGLNNPPQVEDINLQALEGQALITGAINAIDPDGDNLTYQVNGTLPPGFVLNTDGTFQFDASNPAYQSLADGEVNQITIPLTTTDNRGGSVTTNVVIQLTGTETAAVIARVNETVTETDTAVVVTGTVTATDADSPDNTFQPQTINGNTGTLTILENGAWTFVANSAFDELNVGEIVSETFPIASVDGTAGSITLNITGSNDSAIITNASTSLVETNSPLVTSGTLSALDADNPNNGFNAQSIDGTYGTLVIDGDGAWTFTANSAFDELNVEDNLTESFSVSSLDGTPGSITITINGTNDAAETTSDAATLTESDAPLTSSGVLQSSDIDNPGNTFIAQTIVGAQGTLSLEAGGAWTFQANSAFDSLNVGDTLSETFTVASIDGTQSTIEIIINGSNDAAIVSNADAIIVESDTVPTASGILTSSDVDNPDNEFTAQTIQGAQGTLEISASGAWTFTANALADNLNVGDTISETFNVTSIDGTPSTIAITITGTNDAASVSSASVNLEETNTALTSSGTLTSTDPDNANNLFTAQTIVGTQGTLVIEETGTWTFTANSTFDELNVGDSVGETFNVSTIDGTPSTINITINGTNDAATVSSATVVLNETDAALSISGLLTSSDPDNQDNVFTAQTIVGARGTLVIEETGGWTFTANSAFDNLNVGESVSETFNVATVDGTPSTIDITINGTNDAATVSSATVVLDETDVVLTTSGVLTATDPDNSDSTFTAQTIVGTQGTLVIEQTGAWTFTANSAFDSLNVGDSVSETFNVSTIDGTPSTIDISINGTNDAATVSAGTALIVESDRPQTISGVLTATDPDDPDNQFTAETIVGTRGEFTIDSNGAWIFTANSAFNELKAGESVVETFDVTTVNGEPSTVQVTIEGRNEAPLVATTVAPPSLFDSHASDFSGFNFNWRSIDASLVGLQTDNPNGRIEVGRYRVYGLGSRTDYLLELEGNRNDPSNVFKEFETNPGEVYKFTFDHSNRRGAPGINSGINVLQDGTIVETILSPLPGVGFTNYSFDMIATQSTTRFELQALTRDSVGSLIDNMKIELVGFTTDADIPFTIDASVNALDLGVAGNVLEVTLRDIPIGATVTDDNNTFTATAGGQSIDLSSWDLANLTFDHSAAGHHELVVEATLTDASGNVRTTIDTIGFDLLNSDGTPSTTVNANHVLEGSDGGDQISGGIGADELIGGLGDDLLGGGIGVDVFTWEFGDEGTTQSPTVDTLTDFDTNTPTAGGDVLDLRDLLIDEDRSDLDNLDNYLYFENQGSDTVLHISTDGEFNNGFDSSKVEQTIVIENADLLSGFADQQALLQNLINTGKLLVDNG